MPECPFKSDPRTMKYFPSRDHRVYSPYERAIGKSRVCPISIDMIVMTLRVAFEGEGISRFEI
jgi:hypothetical protein